VRRFDDGYEIDGVGRICLRGVGELQSICCSGIVAGLAEGGCYAAEAPVAGHNSRVFIGLVVR